MKCQYCNHNEAENTFIIRFPGGEQEIHLCEECTQKAKEYYEMARQGSPMGDFPAWGSDAAQRRTGEAPFPADAGTAIKQRRRLNGLRARMQEAIAAEHYEEAARLRDEISETEKDVYAL